jgi:hypothetical protein
MAMTNKVGPRTDPWSIFTRKAGAAILENSFVKDGAADEEVIPIAGTGNEAAIGFVDRAYDLADMISVIGDGSIVACTAEGAVTEHGKVVTGNGAGKVKDAGASTNIVGIALNDAVEGERVYVLLRIA